MYTGVMSGLSASGVVARAFDTAWTLEGGLSTPPLLLLLLPPLLLANASSGDPLCWFAGCTLPILPGVLDGSLR